MVALTQETQNRDLYAAWTALQGVMDPEIPVISVVDLGIVRAVSLKDDGMEVVITPTYSGCPAGQQIEQDIRSALDDAGLADARLKVSLSPPWTTDWMSDEGRENLRRYGIAPPAKAAGKRALFEESQAVACPHCGASETELVSEFGSTACKSLWRCLSCREPFDHFKCI